MPASWHKLTFEPAAGSQGLQLSTSRLKKHAFESLRLKPVEEKRLRAHTRLDMDRHSSFYSPATYVYCVGVGVNDLDELLLWRGACVHPAK